MSQGARDGLFPAWAAGTAAAALFLLAAGGMVTSTGSGLSVPDWPLSFGTLNPPMTGGVFFEHGHRLVAGAVALLALALAALSRRPGTPPDARLCALWAAGLILVQALLGGLTVLLRLPPAVSISHACLGQAVFCLLLAAAFLSSRLHEALPASSAAASARSWAAAAFAAAYLQLALGALVRHTGLGVLAHVLGAFAVLALSACAARAAWRAGGPLRPWGMAAAWVPVQMGLGLLALRLRTDPSLSVSFRAAAAWRTLHLVGGAAALALFLTQALAARRMARP